MRVKKRPKVFYNLKTYQCSWGVVGSCVTYQTDQRWSQSGHLWDEAVRNQAALRLLKYWNVAWNHTFSSHQKTMYLYIHTCRLQSAVAIYFFFARLLLLVTTVAPSNDYHDCSSVAFLKDHRYILKIETFAKKNFREEKNCST